MTIRYYTLTTADTARWRQLLPMSASVTGSVEYLRVCEKQTGFEARLFVVEGSGPLAAYPYLMRPVDGLPFAPQDLQMYCDINSPEYRGPIALPGADPAELAALDFPDVFHQFCEEERVIAEFAHLNPWNGVTSLVCPQCVRQDREIVYVDLTKSADELWTSSLTSDARRQTRQGHRAGVTARLAETEEDVLEFHRLHEQTMRRRNALERYFLPRDYFLEFFHEMNGHAFYVLAEYAGRAVAGGLFMHDSEDMYWHLSAADLEYSHVRPVNVYVHHAIMEWAQRGPKRLIMGGAYGAGDGVFRFKTNFSPLRAHFCTYQRIHDQESCDALSRAWVAHHGEGAVGDGYFPPYRATPVAQALVGS